MIEPYYHDEESQITIYCGDCREILPTIEAGSVDLVLTDPPYGIEWTRGVNAARGSRAHSGIQNDSDTSARDEILNFTFPLRAVVFGSPYAPYPHNVKQVLVWHKPPDSGVVGSTTGYRRDIELVFLVNDWPRIAASRSSVLKSAIRSAGNPSSPAGKTGHPHAKPVDLIADFIKHAGSLNILDPFLGSGTTLVACKKLGRAGIGIEISEAYCRIAKERLIATQRDMFTEPPKPAQTRSLFDL